MKTGERGRGSKAFGAGVRRDDVGKRVVRRRETEKSTHPADWNSVIFSFFLHHQKKAQFGVQETEVPFLCHARMMSEDRGVPGLAQRSEAAAWRRQAQCRCRSGGPSIALRGPAGPASIEVRRQAPDARLRQAQRFRIRIEADLKSTPAGLGFPEPGAPEARPRGNPVSTRGLGNDRSCRAGRTVAPGWCSGNT